ncbi:MAG: MBOAT family protein, partial [Oscillospiraceae bacterium]|nr:MBOAT family protein [Oscillospiraceae bacterium]
MVFSSAVFLFVFFPSLFVIYRIVPGLRGKNILLIIASLLFYSFGRLSYLPLLLLSAAVNYLCGLRIGRGGTNKKLWMAIAVVLDIGILCVFKYLDFIIGNINAVTGGGIPLPGIVLPIGISFFTFQGLSYVIDVYRRPEELCRDPLKLLLYISFFPQLIAGPIIKFHEIQAQIDSRTCTQELTLSGIRRFVVGLSKKLLLANAVGYMADAVFALDPTALDMRLAWLGAVCYTFQIYFDFSGYSDMAIGLGRMFGFGIKENFDHPYMASSITEFWRRWHISLSSWFRDYLYIPLGGNRKGRVRTGL